MHVMTKEGNQEGVNERQGPLNEGSKSAREKRFYQTTKELNMPLTGGYDKTKEVRKIPRGSVHNSRDKQTL